MKFRQNWLLLEGFTREVIVCKRRAEQRWQEIEAKIDRVVHCKRYWRKGGTHIVGKSAPPRCVKSLKNKTRPYSAFYYHNNKAWMTSEQCKRSCRGSIVDSLLKTEKFFFSCTMRRANQ